MNSYKFKVWDKQENREAFGKFAVNEDGSLLEYCPLSNTYDGENLDRYIVTWSSGLKDKTGKLIYESDIVSWDDGIFVHPVIRHASVELFPALQFRVTEDSPTHTPGYLFEYGRFSYKNTQKYLTVIGNVHDKKVGGE